MSTPDTTKSQRMTLSHVVERLTERSDQSRRPSVSLKRSVAPGRQGIVEIDVSVPVCDEYPTFAQAVTAAKRTFAELDQLYPVPGTVTT